MNYLYEYFKRQFFIVRDVLGALINLPIAIITLYSLIGAFVPYKTLEENMAYLIMFLICVTYWVWKYLTRNDEVTFWEIF